MSAMTPAACRLPPGINIHAFENAGFCIWVGSGDRPRLIQSAGFDDQDASARLFLVVAQNSAADPHLIPQGL
ncbi:MAG: hypothetical protein HC850_07170 [Rhodomicrobium sp.]|nr:hypothetical protein [Rhodomicrobium sp.]